MNENKNNTSNIFNNFKFEPYPNNKKEESKDIIHNQNNTEQKKEENIIHNQTSNVEQKVKEQTNTTNKYPSFNMPTFEQNNSSNTTKDSKIVTNGVKKVMMFTLLFVVISSIMELIPTIFYELFRESATLGSGMNVNEMQTTIYNIIDIVNKIFIIALIIISINIFIKSRKENPETNIYMYLLYIILGIVYFFDHTGIVPIIFLGIIIFYLYKTKNEDKKIFKALVISLVIFVIIKLVLVINNF